MQLEQSKTKKLAVSALFLAIGIVLPFITMQIPSIGNMLCPMHLPVILCGFLCGGPCGLAVGILTPLLRSLLFGAPILLPGAVAMAFELGTYGLLSGVLYQKLRGRRFAEYIALILAMLAGRAVWGVVSYFLYTLLGNVFTWQLFVTQAFVNAIPGIIIQLVFLPILVERVANSKENAVYARK